MDPLDFDDIASALSRVDGEYRIHFIGTIYDEADEDDDAAESCDTCYAISAPVFIEFLSWTEARQQDFPNLELPCVVFEDPQALLLKDPHSFVLTEAAYEALLRWCVATNAERVISGW